MAKPQTPRLFRSTPRTEPVLTKKPQRNELRSEALSAARRSLIAEAERIMGVQPILGRTKPRPGY
ncbi:MAG: hypothetical protein Q4G49_11080 [Paracoccus sp. (in: a-proteobacteria)]|nr:hypothetical protein [Paracoccus sp. (in: a-proteobacteria)]